MSVKIMSAVFDAQIPNQEYVDKKGHKTTIKSSTMKLVLLALADHASDTGESVYPSIETIRLKTSICSYSTIIAAIKGMENLGILTEVRKRPRGNIEYRITPSVISELHPVESTITPTVNESSLTINEPKTPFLEKTPKTPIQENTEPPRRVVGCYNPDEPDSITTDKRGKKKLSHECPDNWPVMKAIRAASHAGPGEDDARIGREAKLIRTKCEPNLTPDQIAKMIINNFMLKTGYWYSAPHNFGKRVTYFPIVTQIRQHWTKAKEWTAGKRIEQPSRAREVC